MTCNSFGCFLGIMSVEFFGFFSSSSRIKTKNYWMSTNIRRSLLILPIESSFTKLCPFRWNLFRTCLRMPQLILTLLKINFNSILLSKKTTMPFLCMIGDEYSMLEHALENLKYRPCNNYIYVCNYLVCLDS